MPKTSLFIQISVIVILGTQGGTKGWPNRLKLTDISTHSLLMPKTSLFGEISVIAIFGTKGVIFQGLSELAEIDAHKR